MKPESLSLFSYFFIDMEYGISEIVKNNFLFANISCTCSWEEDIILSFCREIKCKVISKCSLCANCALQLVYLFPW